jgi:D-beta-D-heptose 7-phosphate kinase/D-beta-D-heptose 1-phosphate adenosyltransferase
MKATNNISNKIYSLDEMIRQVKRWRLCSKSIVFTNGVFDLLHEGHMASLQQAASYGDILIVAVNNDESVRKLKGPSRPVNNEKSRALLLANLMVTDAVILFEEETPLNLIKAILPDVLVKGGDYTIEQIAGAKEVIENGGQVILANIIEGVSTTSIINKMKEN